MDLSFLVEQEEKEVGQDDRINYVVLDCSCECQLQAILCIPV
jgi:hypothetical protein